MKTHAQIKRRSSRSSLESVITTAELSRRGSRPPDYEAENRALVGLMREMASSPRGILQKLVETALKLCRAHSAGVSLSEEENGRKIFRWHAVAGKWSRYLGGTMPREISPCGTVLDRNASLLFTHPERHFPFPPEVTSAAVEALLIPFHFADKPIGTIWVIAHDENRHFDAEDQRIMESLGKFSATAYQVLSSLDALKIGISERKQAEAGRERLLAQQRRDHEFLERLIESLPVAVAVVKGFELEYTLANPTYQTMSGSDKSLIGCTFPETFPEDPKLGSAQRLRNVIRTGQPYKSQDLRLVSNKAETWWDGEYFPLLNDAGKVDSALILGWEVTERKRSEAALRESEERFRTLFDMGPVAVYSCNVKGMIRDFNRRAAELWGREPKLTDINERFCGSFKMYHPDGTPMPLDQCPIADVLNGKTPVVRDVEALIERPDGSRITVIVNIVSLKNQRGEITGAINCFYDITERKRLEAELLAWQRELETRVKERTAELEAAQAQLLADLDERKRLEDEVAQAVESEQLRLGEELHDGLAQELTGVMMMVRGLEHKLMKPSPTRARELGKLRLLLSGTAEKARDLAKGFYPVELEKHGLLAALQALALRTQESFGVSCAIEADERALAELKDALEIQLFRIAQEAVHNAAKHAHANQILIRLTALQGQWMLTVKDDGVGLQPGPQKAEGMGMRIMRYRAQLIGGKLEVRNDHRGGVMVSCAVPLGIAAAS